MVDPRLNWVTAFPNVNQDSTKPIDPAVKPLVSWNTRPLTPVQASHPTNDISSPTPPTSIAWGIDSPEEAVGGNEAQSPQEEWHFFSPPNTSPAVSHVIEPNDADTSNSAGKTVSDFSDYLWNYNADKMELHPCDDDGKSSSRSRGRVCKHDMFIFDV